MSSPMYDALADKIFYLDPESSPFTHIFKHMASRWPEGMYKCLQRQGYEGKNVNNTNFIFTDKASDQATVIP